ncbi:MAG: HAD-IIIA family hydrolase [Flavobacteriales bacterium]|nr:HAD-IIIA family hydrolase [Flavobacteriales bacterium]
MSKINIDNTWTLFLDRDGVINELVDKGYVATYNDMIFIDKTFEALKLASGIFGRIVIVTTQRGVAKGFMTVEALNVIHDKFLERVKTEEGRIDKIYQCIDDYDSGSKYRKPEIGMALHAKEDFPEIDFSRSIMVGDFIADMQFGRNAQMYNIFVGDESILVDGKEDLTDEIFENLYGYISSLLKKEG